MTHARPTTIHDVARHAGVAVSSVSRSLSGHPDVSDAMRARVRQAAEELGYTPDPIARSMRGGSTQVIGLVLRDYANPFFSQVLEGIESSLSDEGYTLLVTSSGGDPAREAQLIATLRHRRIDALLLATVSDRASATRRAIAAYHRPIVLLDRDFPRLPTSGVVFDHASGVQDATEDLLRKGHRRIALITGGPDIRPTRERVRGFDAAYARADVDPALRTVATEVFSAAVAHDTARRLLDAPLRDRPTALVAGGVQATSGILEALGELGVRPGTDVALVSCDDLPWLRLMRPRISAVSRDPLLFGRTAALQALRGVHGERPETVTLPTVYEERDTTPARVPQARKASAPAAALR